MFIKVRSHRSRSTVSAEMVLARLRASVTSQNFARRESTTKQYYVLR